MKLLKFHTQVVREICIYLTQNKFNSKSSQSWTVCKRYTLTQGLLVPTSHILRKGFLGSNVLFLKFHSSYIHIKNLQTLVSVGIPTKRFVVPTGDIARSLYLDTSKYNAC